MFSLIHRQVSTGLKCSRDTHTNTQPTYLPNYLLLQGLLPLLLLTVQVLHTREVFWLDGDATKLFLVNGVKDDIQRTREDAWLRGSASHCVCLA